MNIGSHIEYILIGLLFSYKSVCIYQLGHTLRSFHSRQIIRYKELGWSKKYIGRCTFRKRTFHPHLIWTSWYLLVLRRYPRMMQHPLVSFLIYKSDYKYLEDHNLLILSSLRIIMGTLRLFRCICHSILLVLWSRSRFCFCICWYQLDNLHSILPWRFSQCRQSCIGQLLGRIHAKVHSFQVFMCTQTH